MFGLFNREKKRQQLEYFSRAGEIGREYERLRVLAPSAGYVFAHVLANARPLIFDRDISREQRLGLIERNIVEATPDRGMDGGLSIAALHFAALMLRAEQHIDLGTSMLACAFVDICKHGTEFRQLTEEDNHPPKNEKQLDALKRCGFSTLAEGVAAIRHEGAKIGQPSAQMERDIANAMAVVDLRRFDEKHPVWDCLVDLESAIRGPFVRA